MSVIFRIYTFMNNSKWVEREWITQTNPVCSRLHFFPINLFCLLTKLGAVTAFYIMMIIAWRVKKKSRYYSINCCCYFFDVTYSFLSNILDLWHQKQDHFHMFSTQRLHCHTSSTYRMNYDVDRIHNRLGIWSFLGQWLKVKWERERKMKNWLI